MYPQKLLKRSRCRSCPTNKFNYLRFPNSQVNDKNMKQKV